MSDHPKWSKAKKQLKSLMCDSLRLRVDFHVINYRKAHDQLGRVVITVDKEEKLSMCTITVREKSINRNGTSEMKLINMISMTYLITEPYIAKHINN